MAATVSFSDPIILEQPIVRGDNGIAELKLRRPNSGELRGLSLLSIAQLEADTLHKLLPRITEPPITEDEARALTIADLFALGAEVGSFLLPKETKAGLLIN